MVPLCNKVGTSSSGNLSSPTKNAFALEQTELLLQTPVLLSALLTISQSRNWLQPTLAIMRLHAYFAQALPPLSSERLRLAQLPDVSFPNAATSKADFDGFVRDLEERGDGRVGDIKKALGRWGRLDVVESSYKGRRSSAFLCVVD